MSNVRSQIEDLAAEFARNVISALRGASIEELYALAGGSVRRNNSRPTFDAAAGGRRRVQGGRLGRRTMDDIGRRIDEIVSLLERAPNGMRAEQIRDALNCEAKELPRPLADGLKAGRITKTGQKRATTYFAGASDGTPPKRRGRRPRNKKKV